MSSYLLLISYRSLTQYQKYDFKPCDNYVICEIFSQALRKVWTKQIWNDFGTVRCSVLVLMNMKTFPPSLFCFSCSAVVMVIFNNEGMITFENMDFDFNMNVPHGTHFPEIHVVHSIYIYIRTKKKVVPHTTCICFCLTLIFQYHEVYTSLCCTIALFSYHTLTNEQKLWSSYLTPAHVQLHTLLHAYTHIHTQNTHWHTHTDTHTEDSK